MKSEGFFVVEGADNLVGKVGIRCEEEVLWSLHNKSIKGKYLFPLFRFVVKFPCFGVKLLIKSILREI